MATYDLRAATESDMENLVTSGVTEGRFIEFKRELPTPQHKAVKEFLADVSSFANAAGGSLVFGVRTERGVAVEVVGLEVEDHDAVTLRFEDLLRSSVEPRLPSVTYHWVPLESSRWVLVITVGRSWAAPHVVNHDGHWRFYSRNAAGKYPLDVQEVRSQVLLTERATEQLRRFRADRIGAIKAGETPVPLVGSARLVLHLVPFLSLSPDFSLTTAQMTSRSESLWPWHHMSAGFKFNVEGVVKYSSGDGGKLAYVQAFRSGAVEAVEAELLSENVRDLGWFVPMTKIEEILVDAIPHLLSFLDVMDAGYPVAVMMSLLNVRGFELWAGQQSMGRREKAVVDRDDLILPDIILESRPEHVARAVRPLFDVFWNAANFAYSPNFDEQGNWRQFRNR